MCIIKTSVKVKHTMFIMTNDNQLYHTANHWELEKTLKTVKKNPQRLKHSENTQCNVQISIESPSL